jgi:hypothetical protein
MEQSPPQPRDRRARGQIACMPGVVAAAGDDSLHRAWAHLARPSTAPVIVHHRGPVQVDTAQPEAHSGTAHLEQGGQLGRPCRLGTTAGSAGPVSRPGQQPAGSCAGVPGVLPQSVVWRGSFCTSSIRMPPPQCKKLSVTYQRHSDAFIPLPRWSAVGTVTEPWTPCYKFTVECGWDDIVERVLASRYHARIHH